MKYQDFVPFYQKLNYKCALDSFESGTYKCGTALDSQTDLSNIKSTASNPIIKKIINNIDKLEFTGNESDKFMEVIAKEKGFDLPVSIVSDNEFNKMRSSETPIMFRGVNRPDVAEKFRSGPVYYNSYGTFGNGIYTGIGKEGMNVAKTYAGNHGEIIPMILKADSKIVDFDTILKESQSDLEEVNKYYNDRDDTESRVMRAIYNDFGKYAMLKGYDAIQVSSKRTYAEPWMVILNRSKIVTTKSGYKENESIKLNFRCPKGTVDDTFSCGKTPEEAKKNYEKLQKYKSKSATKIPEKQAPTQMDAKDIIRRIQSGGKITLEEKNYVQRLLSGESPEPAKVNPAPIKKLETVITKAKKEIASGKVSTQTKKELKSTLETAKEFVTKPKETNNPVMGNIPALINTSDAVLNSLNTKQKDTIEEYSSITHMPINSYLWSGKITNYDNEHVESEVSIKKKIKELDSIFDKVETPEDTVVYRGIPEETLSKMKDLFKAGVEYETPSYTSTTHDKDRAKTFARGKHTATMEIRIPKGSRALALENASNFKAEKEVLIDRGAKFKVLEVKTKKIHGGAFSETKVIVEMIPNKKIKQNSTPLIKLSMKHPGNWSTADSLDTKIKKELKSGVQDVLDVLKSIGYFKEDPKEVALNEAYQKIAQEIFDTHVKLNTNCKEEEKVGSGPGSCGGSTSTTSTSEAKKSIELERKKSLIAAKNNVKKYKQKYKEHNIRLKTFPKNSAEYLEVLRKRDNATENKESAEKLVRTYSYVHPKRTKEITPLLDQSNSIIENASEHEQAVLAQYVFGAGNSTYQKLLSDHNGNIPTSEELAIEWADKEYGHYNKKDISKGGFYYADYMKKLSDNKKFTDEIVKVATAQTAVVDRSITPNDIKIYTGISSRLYDQFELTPGAEFQINQMTSASRDPTIAIGFAKNKNNNGKPTYLEINLQHGSRALALEDFALKENGPDATWIVGSSGKRGMGSQQEVLIGRKLQGTIKEIVDEGHIRKIVVDAKTAELK